MSASLKLNISETKGDSGLFSWASAYMYIGKSDSNGRTPYTDSWFRRYDVSDEVLKTKRDAGLISIENVEEIVHAESNGHVTDDVTRPYDVIAERGKLPAYHCYLISYFCP